MMFSRISREFLIHAGLALGAFAVDWWAPKLLAGHSLIMGQVVYWLAVRRGGPRYGVTPLLCSTLTLWVKWGQPYSALTVALESVLVGLAWRRGRSPFASDVVYWVVIGLPATWMFYRHLLVLPEPILQQALAIQVVNGFIAIWTSVVVDSVLPHRTSPTGLENERYERFLWKRYMTIGIFPLLAASVVAVRVYENSAMPEAKDRLHTTAKSLADGIDKSLNATIRAISIVATHQKSHVGYGGYEDVRDMMSLIVAQNEMVVSARLVAPSGKDLIAINPQKATWSRDHFTVNTKIGGRSTHVTSKLGFSSSRGGVRLLSIAVPVDAEAAGEAGSVEAVLSVNLLEQRLASELKNLDWRAMIVDREMKVVASDRPSDAIMGDLSSTPIARLIRGDSDAAQRITDTQGDYPEIYYVCVEPISGVGWHLIAKRKWSSMLQPIKTFFLSTMAVAACLGVIVAAATAISAKGVLAANRALHKFAQEPVHYSEELEKIARATPDIPLETRDVMQKLVAMGKELKAEKERGDKLVSGLEDRVSERTKQLNEALLAARGADRAKTLFLATISHELRTPLTTIISGVTILRRSSDGATQARTLTAVEKSSRLLYKIISDVLIFSKIDAGAMVLMASPFSPATIIHDVVSIFEAEANEAGLHLRASVAFPLEMEWMGDADHVKQILVNLVGNAIKFTEHGWVEIAASVVPDSDLQTEALKLVVRDTGPGIPEAAAARIFQPFVQLETGINARRNGTGLGLSISIGLARAMGASLELAQKAECGAEFVLCIPKTPPIRASKEESS